MNQTLDEVARRAGVSTATASRALRDLPSVRGETKERVQRVARDMGYVISPSASTLASGRTRTIGLLTPWVNRWFFSNVIEGAEKGLRQVNFDALLYTFHEAPGQPRNRVDPQVLRKRVDGLLILGMQLDEDEVLSLESLELPMVFVGPGHLRHPTVGIDDFAVAQMIMAHLEECGHTRVAHIAGPDLEQFDNSPSAGRHAGWKAWQEERGRPCDDTWYHYSSFDRTGGFESAMLLLDTHPDTTAIFAATDDLAIGAIQAAQARGLHVGTDIVIAGVDDEDLAAYLGLTTVHQNPREQGQQAAEMLLAAMGGQPAPLVTFGEISLVERASSGRNTVRLVN
jgi:DNA-binding LacI/PurR family transcriptional regulator